MNVLELLDFELDRLTNRKKNSKEYGEYTAGRKKAFEDAVHFTKEHTLCNKSDPEEVFALADLWAETVAVKQQQNTLRVRDGYRKSAACFWYFLRSEVATNVYQEFTPITADQRVAIALRSAECVIEFYGLTSRQASLFIGGSNEY